VNEIVEDNRTTVYTHTRPATPPTLPEAQGITVVQAVPISRPLLRLLLRAPLRSTPLLPPLLLLPLVSLPLRPDRHHPSLRLLLLLRSPLPILVSLAGVVVVRRMQCARRNALAVVSHLDSLTHSLSLPCAYTISSRALTHTHTHSHSLSHSLTLSLSRSFTFLHDEHLQQIPTPVYQIHLQYAHPEL
jgi:hypothetical protein